MDPYISDQFLHFETFRKIPMTNSVEKMIHLNLNLSVLWMERVAAQLENKTLKSD